jgi:two-component system, NarL family, sensor kinase
MEIPDAVDLSTSSIPLSCVPYVEGEANRHYQDLVALSRISAAVSELDDLDLILEVALDSVMSIMDGKMGGIMLLDEESRTLFYRVYRGLSPEYASEMRLQLGEGVAGTVAVSGKAELLEDISTDPRAARPHLIRAEGLRAFVSVPLRAKEGVLGVMNVASESPRHYSRSDMHLLHCIGDQVGVAIEQGRLRDRLRRGIERYRELARLTLVAQEQERRRIARELHDETSQSLSGLTLNLQALVQMAEMSGSQDERFAAKLVEVRDLATQIGIEVGRLIRELRPVLLDTLGLVPAIRQYAESSLRPLSMNVSVRTFGSLEALPSELEGGVFRIAQGAIGNIAKHSRAKNVSITLEAGRNELQLQISDDGVGFDVARLTKIEPGGRGAGLFTIKERVALLGGNCCIESQPGQGAFVSVRIPIIRDVAHAEDASTGGG